MTPLARRGGRRSQSTRIEVGLLLVNVTRGAPSGTKTIKVRGQGYQKFPLSLWKEEKRREKREEKWWEEKTEKRSEKKRRETRVKNWREVKRKEKRDKRENREETEEKREEREDWRVSSMLLVHFFQLQVLAIMMNWKEKKRRGEKEGQRVSSYKFSLSLWPHR